jgi:hypothetical protein
MRVLSRADFIRAILLCLTPALAGCSLTGGGSPPAPTAAGVTTGATSASSTGSGISDRMSSMLFGSPAQQGQGAVEPDNPDCPPLDVRQGASTITVYGSGEQAATNVRYQATVGQLARECAVLGATMTIKVGLQGRIILGPVGGPGRLDVPIRFALVQEGPEPKTIWTKLYKVAVDIPAGQTNVSFVHIEDNITFPKPKSSELEAYVIYAGFDQQGLREQPRARRGRPAR